MHVSLYRKYRPQKFAEIVGQSAATGLLRTSYLDGRLGHAYLFSGPRGCGKTTAARILAKVVNCENPTDTGEPCDACTSCKAVLEGSHLDVMEIDAASNRGIDQIRDLRSHVRLVSQAGGSKIYILDEVHMLTQEAFNALLKTLEEPPAAVIFIFATTEPHKVPITIRSRCQHIPFHKISTEDIVSQLKYVASREGFDAEETALWEIARNADGAMRDAFSLAEQALALGNGTLSSEAAGGIFGGGSRTEMERWVSLLRMAPHEAAVLLKSMLSRGVSPERFLDSLFPLLRDMWVYVLWGEKSLAGISLSTQERAYLESETPHWKPDSLKRAAAVCTSLFPRARWGVRSDVFSGLLLFELLGALDSAPMPEVRGTGDRGEEITPTSVLPLGKTDGPSSTLPEQPVPRARPVEPPASLKKDISPGEGDGGFAVQSSTLLDRLSSEDLPLCAALLDAIIKSSEGVLVIDYSRVAPAARALLETPRAKSAIERAVRELTDKGAAVPTFSGERSPGEDEHAGPDDKSTPRKMIDRAANGLGADLLVLRSVQHGGMTDAEEESLDVADES